MKGSINAQISTAQRHSTALPCRICGGHSRLPKGQGNRCYGFISSDGRYEHCTRSEHAGRLQMTNAGTFSHRLDGHCQCGHQHGAASAPTIETKPVVDQERSEAARRIWDRTLDASGTPVQTYLNARHLTLPIPPTIRFAHLHHRPTGRQLPAMVAAVQRWPGLEPVAVHRTYLAPDGSSKAAVPEPKLSYGPIRGAAIRLAAPGETLLVGEGIETTLSGQQETGLPGWAAISSTNMANLVLPELPLASLVIIAADGDSAGIKAAHQAADRWVRQGRTVRIACPPEGQDLNDILRGGR